MAPAITKGAGGQVVAAERTRSRPTAGDGANDTLALKAADVCIAFGSDASPWVKRVASILINDLPASREHGSRLMRRISERLGYVRHGAGRVFQNHVSWFLRRDDFPVRVDQTITGLFRFAELPPSVRRRSCPHL